MEKDLNYWKNNAKEDYMKVPISVLRYITELENEVSNKTMIWLDFEKQKPVYMQCCIIINQIGGVHEAQYSGEENIFYTDEMRYKATHWMPLPEPPKK